MGTVSVNEKVAEVQVFDGEAGIIHRFAQDDHRAIGAIRQAQDGRFPGTAQGLMIAPQHDGLTDGKNSGWQHHFPAAFRQTIQRLLDFGAGHTRRECYDHRFWGGYLGSNHACRRKNQQTHA